MYEPVIIIEAANGTVTVSREWQKENWCYYLESFPTECAHEPIEYMRVFRVGPFSTLEVALDALAQGGAWMRARPLMVHEDVRVVLASIITGESVAHMRWAALLDIPDMERP